MFCLASCVHCILPHLVYIYPINLCAYTNLLTLFFKWNVWLFCPVTYLFNQWVILFLTKVFIRKINSQVLTRLLHVKVKWSCGSIFVIVDVKYTDCGFESVFIHIQNARLLRRWVYISDKFPNWIIGVRWLFGHCISVTKRCSVLSKVILETITMFKAVCKWYILPNILIVYSYIVIRNWNYSI